MYFSLFDVGLSSLGTIGHFSIPAFSLIVADIMEASNFSDARLSGKFQFYMYFIKNNL
jgi:hypothetical protein